ncbi:MAG TPA: hypothetical protein VFT22_15585, partial [Kofleriaceae bacterium]|nr:hypothetical protein [Kofleriaceae bacterium]
MSAWRDAWRRGRTNRMALASGVVFALVALGCFLGPVIAGALGVDGTTIDPRLGATPPCAAHWFGTDTLGRDMLVRVMIGGRIAIVVMVVTTLLAVAIGVTYGAIDGVMMRAVDALY